MRKFFFVLLTLAMLIGTANADTVTVIYDTSFTSAQGAVDGALNAGGSGGPLFGGQGGFTISNAATVGTLNSATGGFQRALFAFDFNAAVSTFKLSNLTGLVAGESITIDTFGAVLTQGTMQVGLANIVDANPFGGSNAALGFSVTSATQGVTVGTAFDLKMVITPGVAAATYNVVTSINGTVRDTQTGVSAVLTNGSADLSGIIRDLNGAGTAGFSVDGLRITTVAVPEPTSLMVLGVCGLGLISLRRRSI